MRREALARMAIGAAAVGAAVAGCTRAIRPWHLRWGATDREVQELLPGDEIMPHPKLEATHAVTIQAPVETVWPWLVQVRQDRGGFYSYSWLENLVGCRMHNADRIHPEWQSLQVGDSVRLHPNAPALPVLIVGPYRAIVLGGSGDSEGRAPGAGAPAGPTLGTWGFYLEEVDPQTTRLIMRIRWRRSPGLWSWGFNYLFLEPAHFVMEHKMMLGIKARAEALTPQPAETAECC